MQLQSIPNQLTNAISITAVRQDIDALTGLLKNYPVVKVLRGSNVLFEARRPETEEEKNERAKRAAETIKRIRQTTKKTKRSGSDYIIWARDRILSGKDL